MEVSASALSSFAMAMAVLFEGLCELEAMKAANRERADKGHANAYDESAFWNLNNSITERFRERISYCL